MPPFDWLDYLDVAKELLTTPDEVHSRASASRTYYGVFGAVRELLEEHRGRAFRRVSVHREVIDALRQDGRLAVAELGRDLEVLRRERVHADYNRESYGTSRALMAHHLAQDMRQRMAVL